MNFPESSENLIESLGSKMEDEKKEAASIYEVEAAS